MSCVIKVWKSSRLSYGKDFAVLKQSEVYDYNAVSTWSELTEAAIRP